MAADYINDPRFSQTFELAPDPDRGRTNPFKVKYADYGYRNEAQPNQENVFLFFGPLMGSRLMHIAKDEIAKRHKIRIINPDRPGMGGTDAVDASHTMSLWREVISALLRHLGIQHVSLGCHSGGTISALDVLLHQPEILHPDKPYLAIAAPWILPSHTGSTVLSIVQSLPAGLIARTDKLATLMNNHIGPMIGTSIGFCLDLVAKLTPASLEAKTNDEAMEDTRREGTKFEYELWPHVIERAYAEGIEGISSDALLFLQKADGMTGWSDWGDYDKLVPRLAEALRAAGKRLRVDVFYAETDSVIGDAGSKGPLWFDQCWDARHRGDVIDYESRTVKDTDHDRIWDFKWGAVQEVFERVGQPIEEATEHVSE